MGLFDFFKSSKDSAPSQQQPTWDPNTLTMQQPASPEAPSTERVVTEQPVRFLTNSFFLTTRNKILILSKNNQESMKMQLRGGGAGDVCCGVYGP
ncbi:hypothetical protein CDV55_102149 [Aspergillus turcosus]|nr:hypothetical protein CDV55_102149 [Aspergillus turcosus]